MKLKKMIACVMPLAIMVAALPQIYAEETDLRVGETTSAFDEKYSQFADSTEYLYVELEDGTLSIVGYNGAGGDIVIPGEIDGKKVTRIGSMAFWGCYAAGNGIALTSVVIPNGVTTIEESAFYYCEDMVSVELPESITTIEAGAFENCRNLKSISIPSGVTEICDNTFYYCFALTNVNLPNNLNTIGKFAFYGCKALTDVTLPNNLLEIKANAFALCLSLDDIIVPASVKKIGIFAFAGTGLSSIKFLGSDFEMPFEAIAPTASTDDGGFYITHKNFAVYGIKGTSAESAAKRLGCTFITLDGAESTDYSLIVGCTDVTAALYDVYSEFLTEYYMEKFPEAALEAFYCTDEEHEFFSKLSKEIIADNPDKSVPKALYDWMNENIWLDMYQYGYPIDVYKYKSADCMGNAYLLCELLRSVDIPAVVAFGWGGDMKNYLSEYNVLLRTNKDGTRSDADHAWVMYYYNGKWCCADSALDIFASDREEILDQYYIFCVDGLSVYSEYYSPIASVGYRVINNGKILDTITDIGGNISDVVIMINEGIYLKWNGKATDSELGKEGWFVNSFHQGYDIYKYIKKNGYLKTRGIEKLNDKTYWFSQNGIAFDITGLNTGSVFGMPVFKVGDQLKLNPYTTKEIGEYENIVYNYGFSPETETVATLDKDGTVKIVGEGTARVSIFGFELVAVDPEPYKTLGLKAESGSDKVKLSWNKMPNAKKYVIKRLTDGVWIDIAMTDANCNSFEIANTDIEYTFAVDVIALICGTAEYRFENEERVVSETQTLTDTENNTDVTVIFTEGTIPKGTELNVEKKISEEYSDAIIYEITLISDGKPVQPTDSVSVRIPIPDGADGSALKVYYRNENGQLTDMKAVISSNYIVFTTDHFSEYIVTSEKLVPDTITGDVNGDSSVNDRDSILLDRYLAEWGSEVIIAASDLNGDGKVNDQDSIILARTLAGWYD